MSENVKSIAKLVNSFSKLPSVGKKTATRYAYKIISMSEAEVNELIDAIKEVKQNVHYCKVCGAFTDGDLCNICKSRDSKTICVVKDPKDIDTLEKTGAYSGAYHVLHGTISPLLGLTPDKLNIQSLFPRLSDCEEIILALSPDIEGDATAMYLTKLIKPLGVKVTKLAQGIPMGQDIEFADQVTLSQAIQDRKDM